MEQAVLQEKLTSSPFLAGASLPPEQVTAKRFRAGQIISDRPGGVSSVGMIVSGRVEVYSVALDGKDVQLNALTAGECFGVCNLLADTELETVLRCGEETEVLYIPKAVLLACMERDAGLAMRYHNITGADKQALLRETLRVLKPGGVFALNDDMKPRMYGDMEAFAQDLREAGFQEVRLVDTATEVFGSQRRAAMMMLGESRMLVGRK